MNLQRLSFGLSRQVWIVEVGVFLNMLGYGAVPPEQAGWGVRVLGEVVAGA